MPKEIKSALRKRRSAAKGGRFPARAAIEDGTWQQKDLNALVAWLKKREGVDVYDSQLLGRERSVITKHINAVFSEGELPRENYVQILHKNGRGRPETFLRLMSSFRSVIA